MSDDAKQAIATIQSNGREYRFRSTTPDEYVLSQLREENRFYEEDLLVALCRLAIKDGVFVDVGANIGNHTVFFSGEMDREVYAFELDGRNFELLRDNIRENRLEHRVRAFNLGLSDHEGVLRFERNDRNSGAAHVVSQSGSYDGEASAVRLDDFIAEREANGEFNQPVSLIKIDVEGHELHVLRGAADTISRWKPLLVVEIHDSVEFQRAFRLLQPLEYAPVLVGAKSDTYVFCHRSELNRQSDLATQYYTRRYEKMASAQSQRALAFSKEFNRIKRLLSGLYESNRKLRADMRGYQNRITELEFLREAWEAETSRLCGVIQNYRDEVDAVKTKAEAEPHGLLATLRGSDKVAALPELRPQYISSIRKRISGGAANALASAPKPREPLDLAKPDLAMPRRASLLVDQDSAGRLADALLDLRGAGIREFDVYATDEVMVPSNVTVTQVDGKLDALEHVMAAVPFSPMVLLDLTSDVDPRKAMDAFAASLPGSCPKDILVLDGIVVETDEEGEDLPTRGYTMADTVRGEAAVAAPFTLNMLLPRPVWIEHRKRLTDNVLLQFAKSAMNDRARFMLLARDAVSLGEEMDAPDFGERLKQLSLASQPASVGFTERLAIVGRLHEERWHKGGIFHSCRAYAEICDRLEIDADLIEIDQAPADILRECGQSRAVFLYTGDQGAQDFFNIVPLLEALDQRGHNVVVNLSYDTYPERTEEILEVMEARSDRVKLMLFSDDPLSDPALEPLAERVVVVPKTIRPVPRRELSFGQTKGIFMGDLGKFINPRITADAEETYRAIRECLPNAPVIFLQQYAHSMELPTWLTGHETLPYSSDIIEHFGDARVYFHAQNYCTFEMLPVEATIAGVPTVYCNMPQSLNSYIGNFGIRYDGLNRMQRDLERLYTDERLWTMMSQAAPDCVLVNSQQQQDKMFKLAFGPLL